MGRRIRRELGMRTGAKARAGATVGLAKFARGQGDGRLRRKVKNQRTQTKETRREMGGAASVILN